MFDLHPPTGAFGLLWTVFAYIGAFGILFALVWVNALIGGLVNAMVTLLAGPIIDAQLKRFGLTQWL
ncbi:MAG TPA: hypothetical protein VFS07_04960 [Gemmatimonadales bacterium]|jgi:hypothetical protein|nr:hypothetical protein [Gemmatimonadales bacterium]HVX89499.1 hypothetical protein [Gemmatimonadales bacterium]